MSEQVINILLIVVIVVLMIANIYFRRRRMEKWPMGKATVLYAELNSNKRKLNSVSNQRRYKKLKTGVWKRHRNKLDFMPKELQATLSDTYSAAEDYNKRLDESKRFGSSSYMAGVDMGRLKEPFDKSINELYAWIHDNLDKPEYQPKRRGLFGGLFGGGR